MASSLVTLCAVLGLFFLAVQPTTAAAINYWYCNTGNCAGGSCQYAGNVTEGSCVPNFDGTPSFVKASCQANTAAGRLCAHVHIFGPAALNPALDCQYATEAMQATPCGVCIQNGPHGAPMMFSGCSAGSANFSFNYDCNSDCSSCTGAASVNGTCQDIVEYLVMSDQSTLCKNLISYTTYSDSNCQQVIQKEQFYADGLGNCNGHPYRSNAAANLFTCV